MPTQEEVANRLSGLGYSTTTRTLEEWRTKNWLPALEREGLGRGKGSRNLVGDIEGIVDRAVLVHWLLAHGSRGNSVLLNLWFAGFDIDPRKAQFAWLERLDKFDAQVKRAADKERGLENLLTNWSAKFAREKSRELGIDQTTLADVAFEVNSLIFDSDFEFDRGSNFYLFEAFFRPKLKELANEGAAPAPPTENEIGAVADVVQTAFSFRAISGLITAATTDDLSRAHELWTRIGNVASISAGALSPNLPDLKPALGRRLAMAIGPLAMVALLYLTKFDPTASAARIVSSLEGLLSGTGLSELRDQVRSQGAGSGLGSPNLNTFRTELSATLEGLNFAQIRQKVGAFQAQRH